MSNFWTTISHRLSWLKVFASRVVLSRKSVDFLHCIKFVIFFSILSSLGSGSSASSILSWPFYYLLPDVDLSIDATDSSSRECWARYPDPNLAFAPDTIVEIAFRVPCIELITTTFVASLQRALAARGYYHGLISGVYNDATLRALRDFQLISGFDSDVLTLSTAQTLGLLPFYFD